MKRMFLVVASLAALSAFAGEPTQPTSSPKTTAAPSEKTQLRGVGTALGTLGSGSLGTRGTGMGLGTGTTSKKTVTTTAPTK